MPLMVHFHLARAAADSRQCIGHRHAQVVVRVRAQRDVVHARHARLHVAEHLLVIRLQAEAHCVGQVQHGGAGFHGGVAALDQVVAVGAARVLGRELHVLAL